MGRSNLRAKAPGSGYNLVDVRSDSIFFTERKPLEATERPWASVKTGVRKTTQAYRRPDYQINDRYRKVQRVWMVNSSANILSSPLIVGKSVVVGNQIGQLESFRLSTGLRQWNYQASGAIYSSPTAAMGRIVFGSADGVIHCLRSKDGYQLWSVQTTAAVLGSPLIVHDTIYIGGSAGEIYALRLLDGSRIWTYKGLEGPVVSTPEIGRAHV